MASDLFAKDKLSIPCTCGQEISETVARLEQNPTLICPKCGTHIKVNGNQLREARQRIQKQIDDLGRTLGKLR